MNETGLKPKQLRALLIILVLLTFGLGGFGMYYSTSILKQHANSIASEINKIKPTTVTTSNTSELTAEIEANKAAYDKTLSLYTDNNSYQATATTLINNYAIKAGVKALPSFDSAISNLPNSKAFSVSISGNVPYSSLIKFIKYIEDSVPKMQIDQLNITRVDSNNVTVENIKIAIYTK